MREMAERLATVDPDAYLRERLADDPVAYFPPLPGWFEPLKGAAVTQATRWFAASVANEVVAAAREAGQLDGPALRARIGQRTDEILGSGGSDKTRRLVQTMRGMATKIGTAPRSDDPVTVNGVLDEPVWQRADTLTDFVTWGSTAPARAPTRVRLAHDGKELYVALECVQPTAQLATRANRRDGSTWSDDSVEIFINPGMDEAPYAQFIVNAAGAFYDRLQRRADQPYEEALSWNCDAAWAARVSPDRWCAELRLPLDALRLDLAAKPLLRMNFVRNVASGDKEISAWFSSVAAHADPLSRGWIVVE
jgi:hypothetical protein